MSQQCYILKRPRPNFGIYSDLSKFINNLKTRNGLYYNQRTSQKVEAGKRESCEIRNEPVIDTTDNFSQRSNVLPFKVILTTDIWKQQHRQSHISQKRKRWKIYANANHKGVEKNYWADFCIGFQPLRHLSLSIQICSTKGRCGNQNHLLTKTVNAGGKSNAAASKYSLMKFWICRVCSHRQVKL